MSETIDTFLDAIERGGPFDPATFSEDVRWDATVPNWRYSVSGADALSGELARWFAEPARFEELRRLATSTGEFLEYVRVSDETSGPVTVHHAWIVDLSADGRVAEARVWCGGRWDGALMSEMAATP